MGTGGAQETPLVVWRWADSSRFVHRFWGKVDRQNLPECMCHFEKDAGGRSRRVAFLKTRRFCSDRKLNKVEQFIRTTFQLRQNRFQGSIS